MAAVTCALLLASAILQTSCSWAQQPGATGLEFVNVTALAPNDAHMLHIPAMLLPALTDAFANGSSVALELDGTLYKVASTQHPQGSPITYLQLQPMGPLASVAGVVERVGVFGPPTAAARNSPTARLLTPSEAGSALTVTATDVATGAIREAVLLLGQAAQHAQQASLHAVVPGAARPDASDPAVVASSTAAPPSPAEPPVGRPATNKPSIVTGRRQLPQASVTARVSPNSAAQSTMPDAKAFPASQPKPMSSLPLPQTEPQGKPPQTTQPPAVPAGADQAITILHFNDWHVRMEPCTEKWHALCDHSGMDTRTCSGGIARMKRWLDDARARAGRASPTLVLNAGDDFIGTVWDRKYGPDLAAHFLGRLGINVSTVGNHEWDLGNQRLLDYLGMLPHPVLGACNLEIPAGHPLGQRLRTYTSYDLLNVKVCILGLATRDVLSSKVWPIKVNDPYWHGKQCVASMQSDGCQVIILLSHLGYTADIVAAQLIPGLDLVVGGHSHSLLWNGNAPAWDARGNRRDDVWGSFPTWVQSKVETGRRVAVVQAGWGSRYMGTVRLWLAAPWQRGPGKPLITRVEGWPAMLGGEGSDAPYSEDAALRDEVRKWRYWHD